MTDETQPAQPTAAELDDLVAAVDVAGRILVTMSARALEQIEENVSTTQFRVLTVCAHLGICNLTAIAEHMGISVSTVQRAVEQLTKLGYVTRTVKRTPTHREVVIDVTEAGHAFLEDVKAARRAQISKVVKEVPPEDLPGLFHAARTFVSAAERPDADWSEKGLADAHARVAPLQADGTGTLAS